VKLEGIIVLKKVMICVAMFVARYVIYIIDYSFFNCYLLIFFSIISMNF